MEMEGQKMTTFRNMNAGQWKRFKVEREYLNTTA